MLRAGGPLAHCRATKFPHQLGNFPTNLEIHVGKLKMHPQPLRAHCGATKFPHQLGIRVSKGAVRPSPYSQPPHASPPKGASPCPPQAPKGAQRDPPRGPLLHLASWPKWGQTSAHTDATRSVDTQTDKSAAQRPSAPPAAHRGAPPLTHTFFCFA